MHPYPHCRIKSVAVSHDRLGTAFITTVSTERGNLWGMYELEAVDYAKLPPVRRYEFYGFPLVSFGEK